MGKMINTLLRNEDFEIEYITPTEEFGQKIDKFKPDMILLSENIENTIEIMRVQYSKTEHKPKCLLLTDECYSEKEKKVLYDKLNIVDYIKSDLIVDKLLPKIKDNL